MYQEPTEIISYSSHRNLIKYLHADSSILNVEEYNVEIEKLTVDMDEDGEFSDLEKEYEYKRFISKWKPQYEIEEVSAPVEFFIANIVGRTDNEFIRPFRLLGLNHPHDAQEPMYRYTPDAYKLVKVIADKYGFTEVKDSNASGKTWSVPVHSRNDMKFSKINGEYKPLCPLKLYGVNIGTWDECNKQFQMHYKSVEDIFKLTVSCIENPRLFEHERIEFVKLLDKLSSNIRGLDYKVKDRDKYRSLSKILKQMNEVLR